MSGEGDFRSHLELRINFREIGQISANALVVTLSRLFPLEPIEYLVYGCPKIPLYFYIYYITKRLVIEVAIMKIFITPSQSSERGVTLF